MTKVIFYNELNGVLAVFPELKESNGYRHDNVRCYSHVGQHSAMAIDYLAGKSTATEKEYHDLLNELISVGYDDLHVVTEFRFDEIPILVKVLTFDGQLTDTRLHVDDMPYWMTNTEAEYKLACAEIDALGYYGDGWQVYASYDVSSYDYWRHQMEEQNYISITVSFDKEVIPIKEVAEILTQVYKIIDEAKVIAEKYNYDFGR